MRWKSHIGFLKGLGSETTPGYLTSVMLYPSRSSREIHLSELYAHFTRSLSEKNVQSRNNLHIMRFLCIPEPQSNDLCNFWESGFSCSLNFLLRNVFYESPVTICDRRGLPVWRNGHPELIHHRHCYSSPRQPGWTIHQHLHNESYFHSGEADKYK